MEVIKNYISSVFMLLISIIFFASAYSMKGQSIIDPAGASFIPALITLLMFITGLYTFKEERTNIKSIKQKNNEQPHDSTDIKKLNEEKVKSKSSYIVILYFFIVLLFIVVMSYLTFYISAFLFLVISIAFLKGVSWKLNLVVSTTTIIVIYLLFNLLFKIVFP